MLDKWFATFTPYQQGLHARFTHIQQEFSILEVTAFDHTRPISFSIVVGFNQSTQEVNLSLAGHYFLSSLSTLSRVNVSLLLRELIAYLHTRMEQHPSLRLLAVTGDTWLQMTDEVKALLLDETEFITNHSLPKILLSHSSPFYKIIGIFLFLSFSLLSYSLFHPSLLHGDSYLSIFLTFWTFFALPVFGYTSFQTIKLLYRVWRISHDLTNRKRSLNHEH